MKKIVLLIFVLMPLYLMIACTGGNESHDIYVTVYPLEYVAEEMLKNTDYTVGIVPGVTSHESSVDWSPKEIISMTEATYLFYIGANYDYYIDYQIDSIFKNKEVELVKVELETDYIEFIPGILHEHNHDEDEVHDETLNDTALGIDPHFWISPKKVLEVSKLIYDKLLIAYPDEATTIEENYLDLVEKLSTLDDDFTDAISKFTKPIMTSTNLYGYLNHDYNLNFMPISPGYHEEADQFTSHQKQEIVDEAIYHEIQYIIFEKYTNSPLSSAVFSELVLLGIEPIKAEFNILQSITDDDLNLEKNYVTVMYENLEILKLAGEYTEG
ncbi:MAG: metal ABC transporter substrate-binding protein [Candidatus Izemoplasmatales bacterium]|nr:metal ABC transporter substrate-binding protein [Candidatus Izemoplasmatales bacterium]